MSSAENFASTCRVTRGYMDSILSGRTGLVAIVGLLSELCETARAWKPALRRD